MYEDLLSQIGLTPSESKVYLALLELGSVPTGKIIDAAKVSSSKIYTLLDKLAQKGLVSFSKQGEIKYYEAAPPKRILDYLHEQELALREKIAEVNTILPELELKKELSEYHSEAIVYKGLKGLETAYYSVLESMAPGDEFLVLGMPERSDVINRFFNKYFRACVDKKITIKHMYSQDARNTVHEQTKDLPELESKILSQNFPAAVNIFPDQIIIFPAEVKEPLLIVIKNPEVVESFRLQFYTQWNQDTRMFKGLDSIQAIFEEMLEAGSGDLIGARGYFLDARPEFAEDWGKRCIAKKFRMRNIVDPEVKGHLITQFPFVETRYTLQKEFSLLSVFWIFGNKVAISSWVEKEPTLLVIENDSIVALYRKQFENLWKKK